MPDNVGPLTTEQWDEAVENLVASGRAIWAEAQLIIHDALGPRPQPPEPLKQYLIDQEEVARLSPLGIELLKDSTDDPDFKKYDEALEALSHPFESIARVCPQCNGSGKESRTDDGYSRFEVYCGRCGGDGEV